MEYKISDLEEMVVERLPFLPKEAASMLFGAIVEQLFSNL